MPHRLLHAIHVMAMFVVLGAGLYPTAATAQYGARDNGNGATLLLPYFEVDLDNPDSENTVITVRNASATAVLAHYTLWTDWGVPVLSFQAYLTGYDVVHADLRALLVDGTPPRTASDGQDPTDTISRQGNISQDINFASCNATLPYATGVLTADSRATLRAELTGGVSTRAAFNGRCVGSNQGDSIARGYITVDTVNSCSNLTPADPGYLSTRITNQNVIGGEYLLYADDGSLLHNAPLATMQALVGTGMAVAEDYTFYGRLTANSAQDAREALNGAWAVDTQGQDAELIVWRDPQVPANFIGSANCSVPQPFPLASTEVLHFGTSTLDSTGVLTAPLAAQRIRLRAEEPGLATGKLGWSYLNLNATLSSPANPPNTPAGAVQAHVEVIQFPERVAIGTGSGVALPLDAGNAPRTTLSPP